MSVTLATPASNAVPTYVGRKLKSVQFNSGYDDGDFITLKGEAGGNSAGTTLQVVHGNNINVYSQVQFSNPPQGGFTQYSTSGQGSGGTFTLTYTGTGQFWYGTDDSAAINNALNSAPEGSDIWLPANKACGVANSINLPSGNSLRGWDMNSSKIVALAQMPVDQLNGYSYVVGLPANNYGRGGGMRDLRVDANKLSQFTCGIEGGEGQFYGNVACTNAVTAEWLCGYPVGTSVNNQISDTIFDHVIGNTDYYDFGPIALKPSENFLTADSCSAQEVINSGFRNGWIAILDSQPAYNIYRGDIMDSIEPYNPEYCIVLSGNQTVSDSRCLDPSGAGIYVNGTNATVHHLMNVWDNAWPWRPQKPVSYFTGVTYGAQIGPNLRDVLVDGVGGGSALASPLDLVVQQGTPDPTTIVINNPGGSYAQPGPATLFPIRKGV